MKLWGIIVMWGVVVFCVSLIVVGVYQDRTRVNMINDACSKLGYVNSIQVATDYLFICYTADAKLQLINTKCDFLDRCTWERVGPEIMSEGLQVI